MRCPKWIAAQDLDRWAATPQAKAALPDLLRRLVFATVPREHLQKVDFRSGTEIQRPGYDGTTVTSQGTAFVPSGICFWELSCQTNPERKARGDYVKRVREHRTRAREGEQENLREASYVAVTARDWQRAEKWAKQRERRKVFKGVQGYDSNTLEHWIQDAPAVGLWLAQQLHERDRCKGLTDLASHWANVQATLRYPLPPKVLLVNRDAIGSAFAKWLANPCGELAVKAHSPAELVAVFCAWALTLAPSEQDAIASRAIVVEAREAWKELATSQQRLILIASPRLETDSELIAEAVRQGHHALRFVDFRTPRNVAGTELAMMRRSDLQEALVKEAGLPEPEARQLAEVAGGSFTILRRRLAQSADQHPGWAQDGALASLLLAAAWEDAKPDDQRIVSQLADKKYVDVQTLMTKWRQVPDAPVRFVLGTWEFLSPLDAWEALHPFLNPTQMDCFERLAIEVLSEDNPALELPPEERFMAAVKGKAWRFSSALRRGIAEILALGATREEESCRGTELRFAARAASIVQRVLPANCGWKRWASLDPLLSLIVEAAPDVVLERIEQDISCPSPQLVELLRQEVPGGLFGAAYHCGVMGAMETAAWPKDRLQRVALCLTRLAKSDPGGQWGNRPLHSVAGFFCSWRPQTMAAVGERIEGLRYLCHREQEGAWKLLLDLLPRGHESISDSAKPTYRDWASGWTGSVSGIDHNLFQSELVSMTVKMAEADPARWPELIGHVADLSSVAFRKVIDAMEGSVEQALDAELRTIIWEKLRDLVQRHTYFSDADSALPAADVEQLGVLRDKFAPADLVTALVHLFDDDGYLEGDKSLTYEQKRESRDEQRRAVIRGIWLDGGESVVLQLAKKVREPWVVGWSLAEELGEEAQSAFIPSHLTAADETCRRCAMAFARQRILAEGAEWAEAQTAEGWQPEHIGAWSVQMPFEPRTWDWVASKGDLISNGYWSETDIRGVEKLDAEACERAAKRLQAVGRAWSSLWLFVWALHKKCVFKPAVLCDALEAVKANPEERNAHAMDAYHIQEVLGFLQNCADADEARVAHLEFAFLQLLDRHPHLPVTLHRQLAQSPELFVECLVFLYAPRHVSSEGKEDGQEQVADPEKAEQAKRVWQLLRNWQTIPGTGADGLVSADGLRSWVRAAREKARALDRLEVCDMTLGELFAHSGEDVDGGRPGIAIRDVIEECASPDLERGFSMGIENSRGCHWKGFYEGGKQERDLAAQYARYAEICARWPRTAAALRNVQKHYLQLAEYEDQRAQARD